jgi:hypothetical protein
LWESGLDETGSYSIDFNRCEIPIAAKSTYLHVGGSDLAENATPISLASRGIAPGDLVKLVRQRDFVDELSGPDNATQMCGIFSASDALNVSTGVHRVTDALEPGGGLECVTLATSPDGEATDISEDFRVSFGGESIPHISYVTVPPGATHLFLAAPDTRYANNSDPEPDFGVMFLPEPSLASLFAIGTIWCAALVRRRRMN